MKSKTTNPTDVLVEKYLEVANVDGIMVTNPDEENLDVSDLELIDPDEDIAFMSSTEIPGTEVADVFPLLETGWVYPNTVSCYRITKSDGLPIFSSGNTARLFSTLVDGGKLYVLKSIHAENEDVYKPYFGERVSARGRCIVYEK